MHVFVCSCVWLVTVIVWLVFVNHFLLTSFCESFFATFQTTLKIVQRNHWTMKWPQRHSPCPLSFHKWCTPGPTSLGWMCTAHFSPPLGLQHAHNTMTRDSHNEGLQHSSRWCPPQHDPALHAANWQASNQTKKTRVWTDVKAPNDTWQASFWQSCNSEYYHSVELWGFHSATLEYWHPSRWLHQHHSNNNSIYKVQNLACRDYSQDIHVHTHTHTGTRSHEHTDHTKLNLNATNGR